MDIFIALLIAMLCGTLAYPIVDWLHHVKGHSYFAIIVCSAPLWITILVALIFSIRS